MTAEEQIKAYKSLRDNGQAFFVDVYEDADRIIEALEKQIPKKPYKDEDDAYRCSVCDTAVEYEVRLRGLIEDYRDVFCSECGQAIDLGDEE